MNLNTISLPTKARPTNFAGVIAMAKAVKWVPKELIIIISTSVALAFFLGRPSSCE
jgi:hypothetical protein